MADVIRFCQIKKYNVFQPDFQNMQKDNSIEFGNKEAHLAVLYAPNGTGKTSFVEVINSDGKDSNISFICKYKKVDYSEKNKKDLFYVIKDHHGRNIINVKETDYLIGDNIQKEYLLREELDRIFQDLTKNIIHTKLKEYGYSTKTNVQYELYNVGPITDICKQLINKADREKCEFMVFLDWVKSINKMEVGVIDDKKIQFLRANLTDKKSLLSKVLQLQGKEITTDERIAVIGKNNDAISIVNKYIDSKVCVVCDNEKYYPDDIIQKKRNQNDSILSKLNAESRIILEEIIDLISEDNDPFNIKSILTEFLKSGDVNPVDELIKEINYYAIENLKHAQNMLVDLFFTYELKAKIQEFDGLRREDPEITEEDLLFVKEFVENSIGREIKLERKDDAIKLTLDNQEIYGSQYEALHLSTGEQNFISLAFEFLKAKNRNEKIVVLDDPISSFDSIFKNKIAFSIIKFLKGKNVIILTHNTDLIRLLEHQLNNSFTLYMLNNYGGARNGFIPVSKKEKEILLGMDRLLELFRKRTELSIQNEKLYLVSLIPFMRGYANLMGDEKSYKKLTRVMHGYEQARINLTSIYNRLFCKDSKIATQHYISVKEILEIELLSIGEIISYEKFPLLNKTLYHSICYLYLRLKVERTLVKKFKLEKEQKILMLAQILQMALKEENVQTEAEKQVIRMAKAKLASKKTLLNEFNHFEGNLNIFQPAIDISDVMLNKEVAEIENILEDLGNLQSVI